MKKFLLLFTLIVAVMMSSCSSDGYKSYIPGDSKVIGKVDLKKFVSQSGIDADKLVNNISKQIGKEGEKIKETGIDFNEPIYFFASGEGADINMGVVAKISDKKLFEKTFELNKNGDAEIEGDFTIVSYEGAAAYSDDAFIVLYKPNADKGVLKSAIRKVINKEGKQSLSDNKVMDKVESNGGFMNLIADMSIIPVELVNMAKQQGVDSKSIEDLRTTTITLDANVKNSICDIVADYSSSDKAVQAKYDDARKMFGKVTKDALKCFSADDAAGLAMNIDGAKVKQQFDAYLKQMPQSDEVPQDILNQIYGILEKVKGNLVAQVQLPGMFLVTAEGQNPSDDIAGFMSNALGETPQKTANGYSLSGQAWFGYAGNNFYVTNNQDLTTNPVKAAATPISSDLTSLMQERPYTLFLNVDKLKSFIPMLGDSDAQQVATAFDEVLNKIHFLTLSMK